MQPQLGKATQFFRQRLIGRGSNVPPSGSSRIDFSFATLTAEEYETLLRDGGFSEHYIKLELEKFTAYKSMMETEGVLAAKAKARKKISAEEDPMLQQYVKAKEKRLKNIQGREYKNGEEA